MNSAEAALAGRGAVHPYLISSFVVSGCAVLFGGVLAVVAIGFALAARGKGETRWVQGVVVAVAALVVGAFIALAFRGFIQ